MATFVRSLTCPDCAYRFSATTNNNEKSGLAMQDYIPHWPRCWPILITCYLVVHHHWINPRNTLREIHLSFHFRMCIYLLSYGVAIYGCSCVFCTFASFSVSLNLIWQPGSLINMDGTISLLRTMRLCNEQV